MPQSNSFDKQHSRDSDSKFPYVLNGRWEVTDKLGHGGMGTVYIANDLHLSTLTQKKKQCAVKALRDDFIRGEDKERAKEFFRREMLVLADLDHANIVRVLDQFSVIDPLTNEDKYYYVMEYVQGQNLYEMLTKRGEPFSEDIVIEWAAQICEVLTYLHTHHPPVIYRDLKPSNVMINTHDQVKLVDFGIARPFNEAEDNTHVVSQGYSPPEQYWGGADQKSDIYSLGATMHFLLTGQDPLALTVSSPRSINPEVSEHLDNIVKTATQQDAWNRFQSARAMRDELLHRPVEVKKEPTKTLYVVLICIFSVGLFLSGLVILAKLQDHEETKAREVTTMSELDRKEKALKDREAKLNLLINTQYGNVSPASSSSPTNERETVLSNSPQEESDEAALTDPAGLN